MTQDDVVAIVQQFVPTYRVPLFDAVERHLAPHGLRLEVWHGEPTRQMASQLNSVSGPWSVPIRQWQLSARQSTVTYRPVRRDARRVRALVHGLASTSLETYLLALDPRVRLMLWGHGRNFTAPGNRIDDALESWLCRRSTHLFVYTEAGARHLVASGQDPDKITVVRNSTDTAALRTQRDAVTADEIDGLRRQHRLVGKRVGLFVGAYDESKDLPFLFEAADLIHAQRDDFVLLLAGAGPLEVHVKEYASQRSYVRVLGRLDAAALGRISTVVDLILMPGRVGLVAVDSLALGVPLVTSEHAFHAPEVDYLDDQTSSRLPRSTGDYAAGVAQLLSDDAARLAMAAAGREAGMSLSIDDAGRRFAEGIVKGLESG